MNLFLKMSLHLLKNEMYENIHIYFHFVFLFLWLIFKKTNGNLYLSKNYKA